MNKKQRMLFALLSVFTVISIMTTTGLAYTKLNESPSVEQAKSMWCWAAAAEKGGGFTRWSKKGLTKNVTQWDIVKKFKGSSYPDEGADLTMVKNAANYAYDKTGAITFYTKSEYPISYNSLLGFIKGSDPIGILTLIGPDNSMSRHAITFTGYNDSAALIRYEDPWEGDQFWITDNILRNGFLNPYDTSVVEVWGQTVY